MVEQQNGNTLSDEAISWFTLLESWEASAQDRQRFAQWRARSADHAQAFNEINCLWNDLDGLKGELVSSSMESPGLPGGANGITSLAGLYPR